MPVILSDEEYADFINLRRWFKNFRGPGIINRPGIGPTILPQNQKKQPPQTVRRGGGSLPNGTEQGQVLQMVTDNSAAFQQFEATPE